jgi:hypothetical protein
MNSGLSPAGYAFLVERYRLKVIPHWCASFVSSSGGLRSTIRDGRQETVYPRSYWPGEGVGPHLEFALKYDGVNLSILSSLFDTVEPAVVAEWVASKPTGKYARRIWYFYEFLTGRALPLADLTGGTHIPLLEPDKYYVAPGDRVKRQRVIDNLLGGWAFCPIVRRTPKLIEFEALDVRRRCEEILGSYSPDLLRRALAFLYSKETKSSFEIEKIKPSASRTEKFIELLKQAERRDYFEKPLLIEAQNLIVDPRFRDSEYRNTQNYVGESVAYQRQLIHFVCPKPEDVEGLMEGLIASHRRMKEIGVPPLIHAAAASYGFVFIHPFEDGNGRIHRFLIHNILSLGNVIPPGLMFPVSAAMLNSPRLYDDSLETFSRPLMRLVSYDIDDLGNMTVFGETGQLYRYIDMTAQAEALYAFVKMTIENELVEELDFLARYDRTKEAIREIVDMPDRRIDLFIRLCLQGNGRLSAGKRQSHFDFLTDEESAGMEAAVREGYASTKGITLKTERT